MNIPLQLHTFCFNSINIQLFVPDSLFIKEKYLKDKTIDPSTAFPYWAQVWPSSIALSNFLIQNNNFIKDKKVLELAGGLGLPSIVAARYAQYVCCSDYLPQAIEVVNKTIAHNHLNNIDTKILNWHHLPQHLTADVLLLSDINYNPEDFEVLYKVLKQFLNQKITIIIATPQRLLAKPFISRLLDYCIFTNEQLINHQNQPTNISTLVLKSSL